MPEDPKPPDAPKQASPAEASPAPVPPAKPAAPAKPAGPVPLPWESSLSVSLRERFGSGVEALSYLGQNYLQIESALTLPVLQILRDQYQFDYCIDVTALHYPKRERPFDVIWILYSFPRNERVRVKAQFSDPASVPTAVHLWPAANWLEREVFDMFGIHFEGHPDLKRILLPDGWKGHPLRKDYGILQQDQEWVQINLGIESGQ
jgi:NADH-quinone oxidoreductase subunit C